jgi:VWFA-related protein
MQASSPRVGSVRLAIALSAAVCAVISAQQPPAHTGLPPAAQQQPPPPDPQPQSPPPGSQQPGVTFRTSVDRVVVDVIVIDRRGRPVADMTADDFTIQVDGKPRRVASASFISSSRRSAPAPSARPPYSSNEGEGGGRQIMIVVDQGNISKLGARRPLEAAAAFIDGLSPADRIGLHVLPGAGPHIDFTANHALVKSALPQVVGESDPISGFHHIGVGEAYAIDRGDNLVLQEVAARECAGMSGLALSECEDGLPAEARMVVAQIRERTQSSLFAFRALLDRMSVSPGPKTILFVSEGLVVDREISDLEWVAEHAAKAQVSLYVLKLDRNEFDASVARISPTWVEDRELRVRGLETLAGYARGAVFPAAADPASAFQRLSIELSGYYLLSFEPEETDRDGKRHRIKVGTSRRDLTIRARQQFAVDPARSSMTDEQQLAEALRSPLVSPDIPLRATTYVMQEPGTPKLKVIVAAAINSGRHQADGELSLAYMLVDTRGRLAASRLEKPLKKASLGPLPDGWQSYTAATLVEPGSYTLKLAVLTPDGTSGSLEHTFKAALGNAGQVKYGDLMIAEPRRSRDHSPRPAATPGLASESIVGYVELYSDAPDQLAKTRVRFEVASDENGRALESTDGRIDDDLKGTRRVAEGRVPVALLPPGDYVARAIVLADGRPVGKAVRPFTVLRSAASTTSTATAPRSVSGRGPARAAVTTDLPPFDKKTVLDPKVVGFFLDRLRQEPSAAAPARGVESAIANAKAGRFEEAQKDVAGQPDDTPLPGFVNGLALYSKGDLEAAGNAFRRALRASPDFFPAIFYLGACYAAGGKDREAAAAWATSLVTEPDAPFIDVVLADALRRARDGAGALDISREAANLWPQNDEVQVRLVVAAAMAGEFDEALKAVEGQLEKGPNEPARLFFAMRILYEANAAGQPIESKEKDLARFDKYRAAYTAAQGPRGEIVEEWRKHIEKGK